MRLLFAAMALTAMTGCSSREQPVHESGHRTQSQSQIELRQRLVSLQYMKCRLESGVMEDPIWDDYDYYYNASKSNPECGMQMRDLY